DLILSAMRAGAADFLPLPLEGDALKEALSRAMRRGAHESQASQRRARVLSFMSVKGGCGATTLAVNLAVSLSAAAGRSAVLVDLDYPGGDVTAMLKMAPAYSLADVAANIHRLDMDLLNSMTMRHDSGLRCLAAVTEGEGPSRGIPPSPDQLAAIVRFLADHFDDVILAGGALGESELAALNQAHMVHLVTTLDFLSLRRAQALIGRLREFGVTGDALRVIVNRVDRGADLTLSDAKQALDAPVVWSVPDDPATAERAINEGVPLVSKGRSRLQAAFEEYAKALSVGEKAHAAGGLTGLFRRLVPARA
ncbi:MAG TPA: P-loop NTPase, partial [Candidatus Polarisedimenticolia bacterium]|nr:P-loop NTPase [Candidatus Polarisedimenticolia bacterium]